MYYKKRYASPIGMLDILQDEKGVCGLSFDGNDARWQAAQERETALLKEAAKQLDAYFAGERKQFDLPLSLQGTPFQKRVWDCLMQIPYGETRSYREIAAMAGNPKACRAVGMANNRNPAAIFVPCHRVIGADGSLTGYGGGIEKKKWLLRLEGAKL